MNRRTLIQSQTCLRNNQGFMCKKFLTDSLFQENKLHGDDELFHSQIEFHSNALLASALLLRCLTQETDGQYSYQAKNVKRCLLSKIICVESHYTLFVQ